MSTLQGISVSTTASVLSTEDVALAEARISAANAEA
jgi:hypothetical protein